MEDINHTFMRHPIKYQMLYLMQLTGRYNIKRRESWNGARVTRGRSRWNSHLSPQVPESELAAPHVHLANCCRFVHAITGVARSKVYIGLNAHATDFRIGVSKRV